MIIVQNTSGERRDCPLGFSWTNLFFGAFVPLINGDWKWFVFPFIYNKMYINGSLSKGFYPSTAGDADKLGNAGIYMLYILLKVNSPLGQDLFVMFHLCIQMDRLLIRCILAI